MELCIAHGRHIGVVHTLHMREELWQRVMPLRLHTWTYS